jgi:glycopeptide antibiotics resistance protein
MQMIPFDDLIHKRGDALRQILLNTVMTIPFGFLLPLVKKQSIFTCILWTFLFSLAIELLQPLLNGLRSADVTDLITNTAGGIIGYAGYLLLKPYYLKIEKKF